MSIAKTLSKRISQKRAPAYQVNWRRLYALPTRHGLMVALSILGVFAISVRVQNNMLLLLAVSLFVIFMVSVIWAALNLDKLKALYEGEQVFIQGQAARADFSLGGRQHIYDLWVNSQGQLKQAQLNEPLTLPFIPQKRGHYSPPPFLVETQFPFGLVKAWQWLSIPAIYVAPEPDYKTARRLLQGAHRHSDFETEDDGHFNADSLESWMPGIPLSRISWKHYASKDRLLYKTGADAGREIMRLHFDDLQPLEFEAALRVLCAGILEAVRLDSDFELQLPHKSPLRYASRDAAKALIQLAICKPTLSEGQSL